MTRRFGASTGNLGIRFDNECVKHRGFGFESLRSERLQVKTDCGATIRQRGVVRFAFAYYNPFEAEWIRDETIGMLLHKNL
jgi:hypothetical protein